VELSWLSKETTIQQTTQVRSPDITYATRPQHLPTVDDGTGTITCIYWSATEKIDYSPLPLGTSVRITGKISTYRDERQIVIYDICMCSILNVGTSSN